jgi:FeS assembly SUF system regulator
MTDYGVVALSKMALQGHRPDCEQMTVAQLAADTGVNQPTIAKLMKQLTQAAIVTSQRGANGGYTLARAPEGISVTEIIEALEGPIELTSCVDGAETNCGVESLCPMRGNWDRVNGAIRSALDGITLADMATPGWRALFPEPTKSDRQQELSS